MATPGIFVLSTQGLPAGLIRLAAAAGVQLDAMAFIRTEPLALGDWPGGATIAVFTSQHAVEALSAAGPDWTVFCLEGATRKLAEQRFGPAIVAGTASSAAELAEVIIGACAKDSDIDESGGKQVVFFCGDRRREELPALLRQAGFRVEERIVYRTLLTPHRLEREYAGIAFFSPSAVESFFSVNTINPRTALFAIGRTTAAAVQARTGKEAILSSRPDREVLIHEMITYFKV
jgi:uroporphyrinogen-III synthase